MCSGGKYKCPKALFESDVTPNIQNQQHSQENLILSCITVVFLYIAFLV